MHIITTLHNYKNIRYISISGVVEGYKNILKATYAFWQKERNFYEDLLQLPNIILKYYGKQNDKNNNDKEFIEACKHLSENLNPYKTTFLVSTLNSIAPFQKKLNEFLTKKQVVSMTGSKVFYSKERQTLEKPFRTILMSLHKALKQVLTPQKILRENLGKYLTEIEFE